MKKTLIYWFLLIAVIFVTACSKKSISPEQEEAEKTSVLTMKLNISNAPVLISHIEGQLIRDNYETLSFSFELKGDSAYAFVDNIIHIRIIYEP